MCRAEDLTLHKYIHIYIGLRTLLAVAVGLGETQQWLPIAMLWQRSL